jgi:hypothetical protein
MNQQDNREDDKTPTLVDLELTTEQANETKAGVGRHEGAFMGNLFSATPVA